jgi:hypothetical protein
MKDRARSLVAASALLLAACATGGGMYDQPYALFQPQATRPTEEIRPTYITAIDGVSRNIGSNEPVAPGVHEVEVTVPGAFRMGQSEYATLKIEAKPCVRYLLGAKQLSLASTEWNPVIAATEPIGECLRKFPTVKQ